MKSQYTHRNNVRYITSAMTALGVVSTAALVYAEKYWTIPTSLFGTIVSGLLFTINEFAIRSEIKANKKNNLENKFDEIYPENKD